MAKGIAITGSRENMESKTINIKETIFLKGTDEKEIIDTIKKSKEQEINRLQWTTHVPGKKYHWMYCKTFHAQL